MGIIADEIVKWYNKELKESNEVSIEKTAFVAEAFVRHVAINFALDEWAKATGNQGRIHHYSHWIKKLDKFMEEDYKPFEI
jgi:phosphopantetheine adenylyltransferase